MDPKFYKYISDPGISDSERAEIHQKWLNYKGIKVFANNKSKNLLFDPSIYVVEKIIKPTLSLDVRKGIYKGGNSGLGALMLAISLGANPIYLLGIDLKVAEDTRATHWHNGYPKQKMINFKNNLNKFKENFELMSPIIKAAGIEVINLNPDSALDCFPKKSIGDIRKVDIVRTTLKQKNLQISVGYDVKKLDINIISSPSIIEKRIEFEKKELEKEIEFICSVCGRSFTMEHGLNIHIGRTHPDYGKEI
ncbi:MAG: hypothetical protein ACTSU7_01875 [Candidatus Heimdallarchaeaceae archaeon]